MCLNKLKKKMGVVEPTHFNWVIMPGPCKRQLCSLFNCCLEYVIRNITKFNEEELKRVSKDVRIKIFEEMCQKKQVKDKNMKLLIDCDIRGVNVSGSELTFTGLQILANYCPNLKTLSIRNCRGIRLKGVSHILRNCPHLELVDMSYTTFLSPALNEDMIVDMFSHMNPNIKHLALRGSISSGHQRYFSKALDKLSHVVLKAIADYCPNVRYLNIGKNRSCQSQDLVPILNSCKDLEAFDISWCPRLDDQGIRHIANSCNTKLTMLNLNFCRKVTPEGIIFLAQKCQNINDLNLKNNTTIDDEVVFSLARHMQNLVSLNLAGCHEITDNPVIALGRYCTKLQSLSVMGLQNLTDEGVDSFLHYAKSIKELNLANTKISTIIRSKVQRTFMDVV